MPFSKYFTQNNAQGIVINDTSSAIVFDTGHSFPTDVSNGEFLITLGPPNGEIVRVTDATEDVSGVLTVTTTRAQEGTSYVDHTSGTMGYMLFTAGQFNNFSNTMEEHDDKLALLDVTSSLDLNEMYDDIQINNSKVTFDTTASTKVSYIDVTSSVNLNTIYNDTQTNNAKVTNATHTGDVTGADVLGIVPAAISGKSEVTPATGDYVLLFDATDNNLKKALVDSFLVDTTGGGGGSGDVVGPASATANAVAIYDSTTGKLIKNTGITIDGSNNITGIAAITASGAATFTNNTQVGNSSTNAARYLDLITDTSNRKGVRFYRGSNVKWVVQSDTDHSFKLLRYDTTGGTFVAYDMIVDGATGNISVSGTVDGRDLANDGAKLDLLDVTSSLNLNTMYNDIEVNNAKVTNANHTGDVTGADVLGIVPAAISGKSAVTPAAGDYVLLFDATDNTLKKSLVDTFISGGGGGDVTGAASSTDNGLAIFNGTGGKTIKNSSVTVPDTSSLVVPGFLTVTGQARHAEQTTLTSSGTVTWNINNNPKAKINITGNITTFTISGINLNSEATLYIKQDASSAYTIAWPAGIIWAGNTAPDLSTLNSNHIISFYSYDGTNLMGSHLSDDLVVIDVSGAVTSVNTFTGAVTLDADDISDSATTNKFVTSAQKTKIDYIDVTSAVNLNTLSADVTTNNAKVTNANHTGDVTGAGVLGIVPAAISSKSEVTAVSGDYVLLFDATDNNLKKANVSDFISPITASSTSTFTNKRITKRVTTITDGTGLDINCDNFDVGKVTLQGNRIINKPSGTPTDGQQLLYCLYQDVEGNRTIGFNAEDLTGAGGFRFGSDITGITLSTAANKKDLLLVTYLSDVTGWCISAFTKGF